MFKNLIIIFLIFMLGSLLFQNKKNVKIIAGNLAVAKELVVETKDFVVDGTNYVTKAFEEEFSVQELDIDIPSLQIEKEPMIREDTFFNEEEK